MTTTATRLALFAASATAVGLLTGPAPAQAAGCSQWGFNGYTLLSQSNGWDVDFNSTGKNAQGRVRAADRNGNSATGYGTISGGTQSDNSITLYVHWDGGSNQTYSGKVDATGNATGTTVNPTYSPDQVPWRSLATLQCLMPAPPPPPGPAAPPAPPGPPPATLSAQVTSGPATLAAGLSGTYVVTVTNTFTDPQPVRVGIVFAGKLDQTGQINAQGGLDCVVAHDAGINAAVNCTGPIPKGTTSITVQGRGSAPGAGQLVVTLNGNVTQQNVSIT